MKKKFLTLMLTLCCLCGATACDRASADVPKSAPQQQQTRENDCPGGDCPQEKDGNCPGGNCPEEQTDGTEELPELPTHPVYPRIPDDRLPPKFPVRPRPPIRKPYL